MIVLCVSRLCLKFLWFGLFGVWGEGRTQPFRGLCNPSPPRFSGGRSAVCSPRPPAGPDFLFQILHLHWHWPWGSCNCKPYLLYQHVGRAQCKKMDAYTGRAAGRDLFITRETTAFRGPGRRGTLRGGVEGAFNPNRCRANSAHIRQSRPDSGLGLSHFSVNSPEKTRLFPARSAADLAAVAHARARPGSAGGARRHSRVVQFN